MRPSSVTTCWTARRTASASPASAWIARPLTPSASSARTTSSALSGELWNVIATDAPSRASRFAMAAPIPRDAPVTSATFPSSVLDMNARYRGTAILGANQGDKMLKTALAIVLAAARARGRGGNAAVFTRFSTRCFDEPTTSDVRVRGPAGCAAGGWTGGRSLGDGLHRREMTG